MDMGREIPAVPNSVVDRRGAPRFGSYRGELPMVALGRLGGAYSPAWWKKKVRKKRWNYAVGVTDEVLICQAVVDGGYFANAFYYAVDLFEEKLVARGSFVGLPGVQGRVNDRPARGHEAVFSTPGVRLSTRRGAGDEPYYWQACIGPLRLGQPLGLCLDAEVEPREGAPALTVIAPVSKGGIVNITQKWAGLPMQGRARIGSRTYDLDGGLAGLDYTQGILARRTAWRWALGLGRLGDGRRVGVNLVAGFNDDDPEANENALWLEDELIPLGRARFEYSAEDPSRPWTVETLDKKLELVFQPYYVHREDKNLGVINSRFLQPAGHFEGRLKLNGEVHPLFLYGVTEDQDIRW